MFIDFEIYTLLHIDVLIYMFGYDNITCLDLFKQVLM